MAASLQGEVDERQKPGRFVLTGPEHFRLSETISQSLAGRTAVLFLLPPDLEEIRRFPEPIPCIYWEKLTRPALLRTLICNRPCTPKQQLL